MSNHTVPAAAEGMPASTTRRHILMGAAALTGIPVMVDDALASIPSWMELRIEAHRDAQVIQERLEQEADLATAAFEESITKRPVYVPLEDANGRRLELDLYVHDFQGVDDRIDTIAQQAILGRAALWASDIDIADIVMELTASRERRARNEKALDIAWNSMLERRDAFGLNVAEKRRDDALQSTLTALDDLLNVRPRSLAEAQARARYLIEAGIDGLDSSIGRRLLASMAGMEAQQ